MDCIAARAFCQKESLSFMATETLKSARSVAMNISEITISIEFNEDRIGLVDDAFSQIVAASLVSSY